MELLLVTRLSTLSHPHRMAVFKLLMRRYPDPVPAGEISTALTLKPSTASVYLSALHQAGLITQKRESTRIMYAVDLDAAREVVSDLFMDCCHGRADLCPPMMPDAVPPAQTHLNVLFVCTGNSARSIMAETILRAIAPDRFNVFSAGTAARSELNPLAVQMLRDKGHDVAPLRAKNLGTFRKSAPQMDFVFTVCDHAANEECPAWAGQPVSGHWGLPDPVKATGTDAQKSLAFQETYGALHNKISAFAALPFDSLTKRALQTRIDDIGRLQEPSP